MKNLDKFFKIKLEKNDLRYGLKTLINFLNNELLKIQSSKIGAYFYQRAFYGGREKCNLFFSNSLEKHVKKYSHFSHEKYTSQFYNYLWNNVIEYYLDENEINIDELIFLSNVMIELIFSLTTTIIDNEDKEIQISFWQIISEDQNIIKPNEQMNNFISGFETCIEILKFYSLRFNQDTLTIERTEQGLLIDNINSNNISNLVYEYKKANNFDEKYKNFCFFAKEYIYPLLNNSKKFKNEQEIIKKFIDDFNNLKNECNGYFRHSPNDSGATEKSKYWDSLENNEKIKIMNETLSVYLFLLSILRDHNFDINFLTNEFVKNEETTND